MLFDEWSPVTSDFGLIDAPPELVVKGLVDWHTGIGVRYERKEYDSLRAALQGLLPLANAKTRRLFVPTSTGWTACFQNGIQGSDPFPAMSFLASKLGVVAMRICNATDDTFPAIAWEVYAPES